MFGMVLAALAASPAATQTANRNWIAAWGTSQQGLSETKISNATVRMIVRVTIPGDAVRVRLDNTFGKTPVVFSHASIGPRVRGPALAAGLIRTVMFGGKNTVTIPAGGTIESDLVALDVDAQQDLAVSLFVSGTDMQPSQHTNAYVTSYVTDNGAGDQTQAAEGKGFAGKTTAMYWLKSIDVRSTGPATAIVAFGDSITDGACTTLDAHDRWEDVVAQRLALQMSPRLAVVNEGIDGNTVLNVATFRTAVADWLRRRFNLPVVNSLAGVERLERDVLSHPGVSHVVLSMGTNDIRQGASADQVIGGMKDIIARVKAKNIKIIGATIIPRQRIVPGIADTGLNDKIKVRNRVNEWMRKEAGFDAVLDFDHILRAGNNPDLISPAYSCGDGLHPSPMGYFLMGKSVDLGVFRVR